MSTKNSVQEKPESSVSDVINAIKAATGNTLISAMLMSGTVDGELSGVVFAEDGDDYIDAQELAPRGVYLLLGLRVDASKLNAGIEVLNLK